MASGDIETGEVGREASPPTPTPTQPPPAPDAEGDAGAVASVVHRWRREAALSEKGGAVLRGLGALFSLIAFAVMASNEHGDWNRFDKYEEYRYLVAISFLAFIYSAAQLVRHARRITAGKDLLPWPARTTAAVDFVGDQVAAYLLISAASAAVPMTNRMREGSDNAFTDASAAAISMAFFAFAVVAASAIFSGYKLAKKTYI